MKTKTLAMLKMEKNFIAVIKKGYPRKPYKAFSFEQLFDRLVDEMEELENALKANELTAAMLEVADVSNLLDYIFEKLTERVGANEGIRLYN